MATDETEVSIKDLRETIRQLAREHDEIYKRTVLNETAASVEGASPAAVSQELARMQRNGEVYFVGDEDDNPEVRVP